MSIYARDIYKKWNNALLLSPWSWLKQATKSSVWTLIVLQPGFSRICFSKIHAPKRKDKIMFKTTGHVQNRRKPTCPFYLFICYTSLNNWKQWRATSALVNSIFSLTFTGDSGLNCALQKQTKNQKQPPPLKFSSAHRLYSSLGRLYICCTSTWIHKELSEKGQNDQLA